MTATESSFLRDKRVWVACQSDVVSAAIIRRLWRERCEIVLAGALQVDLLRQAEVEAWFRRQRPDVVFLSSAATSATGAPRRLQDRLMASMNVLAAARETGVSALVNVAAGVTPPASLDGPPAEAARRRELADLVVSRIAHDYSAEYGARFMALVAQGVYDPASAEPEEIAALVSTIGDAARRGLPAVALPWPDAPHYGLLTADDLAEAAFFLVQSYAGAAAVNCRCGSGATLRELAETVADVIGYRGAVTAPVTPGEPEQLPLASVDIGSLGWQPASPLADFIRNRHREWLRRADAAPPKIVP